MQIIIPMSGVGQRFVNAGYTTIKPLILVHGKPIIEYVIKMFDVNDQFIFVCNEDHIKHTALKQVLLSIIPNATIVSIALHKYGPVYAVQQAFKYITDDDPCIVNYCDFNMVWNYAHFKEHVTTSDVDGSVVCYTGFHPHLIPTQNVYAACKVGTYSRLLSIKEKHVYEHNKLDGYYSTGTYYFKTGAILKQYTQLLLQSGNHINGEYYSSMLYDIMVHQGQYITVYGKVTHYCQWGTPQDLAEYTQWYTYNDKVREPYTPIAKLYTQQNAIILMPMAGAGSRYALQGYTMPKPLIPINDIPMYKAALQDLPSANTILITQHKLHDTSYKIIPILTITQGQASTCMLAEPYINNDKALYITACDNGLLYDYNALLQLQYEADVIVFTYQGSSAATANPSQYGWVQADDYNTIQAISCKKALSPTPQNDAIITGTFWFKRGNYFVNAATRMIAANRLINNEYYVDECIADCIQMGLTVKAFAIDHYIGWGTPNELNTYLYWQQYYLANSSFNCT